MSKAGEAALRGRGKSHGVAASQVARSAGISKAGAAALKGLGVRTPANSSSEGKAVAGEIDETDLDKAMKSLTNKLKKIDESDAPEGEKDAAAAASEGKHGKGLFGKIMDVLDTPRAAAVAGLHQLGRLNPNAETVHRAKLADGTILKAGDVYTDFDGNVVTYGGDRVEKGVNPSFTEDFKNHIGVGEILEENKTFASLPTPVKIAAGFIGDVAFDPLSYLGPEKKIAELGGKKGIAEILFQAGHQDAAAKVLRKGVSSLSKEERAAAGIKGGLFFNIPGTGHVAQRAADAATFGKWKPKTAQIQLLRGGGRASELPRALQSLGNLAGDNSNTVKFLRKYASGKNSVLKADLRSGDPVKSRQALVALRAMTAGPIKGMGIGALQGERMQRLIQDAEKSGLGLEDLTDAVAGDPEAIARARAAHVDLDAHAAWWEESAQAIDDAAGKPVIKRTQNYVARIRSEAARKLLGGGEVAPTPHAGATFEHARVKPGDDWLGYDIHEPGAVVEGVEMPSVEKQISDINAQVYGEDAVQLYERDYRKIVGAYLNGISKRAGELHTEKLLRDNGVLAERYANTRPTKRALKNASKAQKLRAEAEDLAEQEWRAKAEVDRLHKLVEAQKAEAANAVGGVEAAAEARALEESVAAAVAEQEQIAAQVAERLGVVREAQERVTTLVGETNHPYERYTDLLDKREGLQARIDELNDLASEGVVGSGEAARKLKNPYLHDEVAQRLARLNEEIATLEGTDLVRAHTEREALAAQLEALEADVLTGREVRAELHKLNLETQRLTAQLDSITDQPRVVAGLRQGMGEAEQQIDELRALLADPEAAVDPAAIEARIDNLELQRDLHRDELERLGVAGAPRPLDQIEHDVNFMRDAFTTAQDRAAEWNTASHIANTYSGTQQHQLAVEAAEQIRRLKEATGFSSVEEVNGQARALFDYMQDLQREHYARLAYEGQILPEHTAGTAEQVRQQLNRVKTRRERLGLTNEYDDQLAELEARLGELDPDDDTAHLLEQQAETAAPKRLLQETQDALTDTDEIVNQAEQAFANQQQAATSNLERLHQVEYEAVHGASPTALEEYTYDLVLAGRKVEQSGMGLSQLAGHRNIDMLRTHLLTSGDPALREAVEASLDANGLDMRLIDPQTGRPTPIVAEHSDEIERWAEQNIQSLRQDAEASRFADPADLEDEDFAFLENTAGGTTEAEFAQLNLEAADDYETWLDGFRQYRELANTTPPAESVAHLSAKQKALHADEIAMRQEAAAKWKQAEAAQAEAAEPFVAKSLALEATAAQAEAKLAQLGHKRLAAVNLANLARDKALETFATQAVDALHDGMVPFGYGEMLPEHVAEALLEVQKVTTPEGMQIFLQYHDKALGLWKAYAIATPGFHFRNFFGGQFNMYLQGVDIGLQRRFIKADLQFQHAFKANLNPEEGFAAIKDARLREVYSQIYGTGLFAGGGQISNEIVRGITSKGNANPLSTDFAPLRFSAKRGEQIERYMRGTSAAHVLLEGGSVDDALEAVFKYHFNYDDLSKFERNVAKRIIPFYTWTRKNFTLQIEELIRQPHKYKRYLDVKRNSEQYAPADKGAVPDYFGRGLAIRLPWKTGGESAYTLPDLPFKSLAMDSPSEFMSSASPFVKTPLEIWAKKQFFAGLPISDKKTVAPSAWQKIPGLMPTLNTMGLAEKDKGGRYIMSGKNAYLIEQFLPPLQRARRLAPNEPKYQQRVTTTWLSFAFGASVRTNTMQGQYSELRRRDRQLSAVVADLQDRGYLEKAESST